MTYPNPIMAHDSTVYPGSPWKGQAPKGRSGCAFDSSRATWVPRAAAPQTIEAENARRAAIFLASFPGHAHLK